MIFRWVLRGPHHVVGGSPAAGRGIVVGDTAFRYRVREVP